MLEVPACGGSDEWTVDNPRVQVVGENCLNNALSRKVLKPGELYESSVPVFVDLGIGNGQPESVTFRLGFKDPTISATLQTPPIWSNTATINVTR